jgi:hypothetical protein
MRSYDRLKNKTIKENFNNQRQLSINVFLFLKCHKKRKRKKKWGITFFLDLLTKKFILILVIYNIISDDLRQIFFSGYLTFLFG